jgi:hypothetical protein
VGGGAKSDSIVLIGRAGYYNDPEVFRSWLVLAVLCAGTARGAGPSYSAAGIVNASNHGSGPLAPNSVVSIFGSGLARSSHALAASDISGGMLPLEMNYVSVAIRLRWANQLPHIQLCRFPGRSSCVWWPRASSGPEIDLTLVNSAPALLADAGGYAIATTADGKLFTADGPAHAGNTIVVYCTGLQDGAESPACGDSKPRGPDSGNARA